MIKAHLLAIVVLLGSAGGCALVGPVSEPGLNVLRASFDPDRSFAGDLRESSDDELVFTAWASARDDYAPAYSLAIAFRCVPADTAGDWQCGHSARMLRTDQSLLLVAQAEAATTASEMRQRLDGDEIEWLEADVVECPGAILAMDSVRIADWRPDIHYRLQAMEDRQLLMHPAAIRVTMHGSYATTTYEGWRLAPGVPAAVQHLIDTLEPCWSPSKSPRPWRRRDAGPSGG